MFDPDPLGKALQLSEQWDRLSIRGSHSLQPSEPLASSNLRL
jgi:hypothetical protein